MSDRIQLRRGTASQWAAVDPVLADGELGWDRTNNQLKAGNGAAPWSALSAISAVTLSGFATLVGGNVPLSQLGNAQRHFMFDLRDYSAVGDGATEDTSALQAAIDAASAAGGGIVLGEPGKSYFCSNLQAKSNVIIDLQGATLKRRTVNTTQITIAVGISNVEIRNVVFDGQRSVAAGTPSTNGAITVQGSYVLVHRCVFNDLSGSAVVGSSGTYVKFRDSIVTEAGDHVMYASTTAHDWIAENIISTSTVGDGAYKVRNGVSRFTVKDCWHTGDRFFVGSAESSGNSHITLENCVANTEFNPAIFSGTVDGVMTTDVNIIGCAFTNTTVGGYNNIDFGFATTPGAASAIRIERCRFIGYQGFQVLGTSAVPVDDVIVERCTFINTTASTAEIFLSGCSNVIIRRCLFNGNGHSRAIEVNTAPDCIVEDCRWTGNVVSLVFLGATALSTGHMHIRRIRAVATSRFITGATPTGTPTFTLFLRDNEVTQSVTDNPNAGFIIQYATPVVRNATTSTNYTLLGTDAAKLVERSNASANTLTVPPNSSVPFPIGTQVTIVQTSTGQTTLTPGAGVTINANPGLKLTGQWSGATLFKRATDTWIAIGDLSA